MDHYVKTRLLGRLRRDGLDDATLTGRRVLDGGRARALPRARRSSRPIDHDENAEPFPMRSSVVFLTGAPSPASTIAAGRSGTLTVFVRNGPLMSLSRSVHAMCLLKVRAGPRS